MKFKHLISYTSLLALAACGGSSGGSGSGSSSTSDFNVAYEQLVESAPAFGAKRNFVMPLTAPNLALADWSGGNPTFHGLGSDQFTPQDFVGALMNEAQDQSIFERARMPFLISCCLDVLAPKTGDLFTAGTHDITFTSAVVGVCGSSSDFTGMIGEQISIVVTDLGTTTNYDQMIFFDHTTNPLFSTSDQWMYVRNNSSILNFMHVEDSSAGFDGSSISVNSISYDKTTQGGFFQFVTKYSGSDIKLYRVAMDQANDDARIYAHLMNVGGGGGTVSLSMASTFANQTQAGLSMTWANQSMDYADLTDGNACITTSTGAIATDNTLTCAGKTVEPSSSGAALDAAAQGINGGTIRSDAAAGSLADNLPTFDDTDIFSASLGL